MQKIDLNKVEEKLLSQNTSHWLEQSSELIELIELIIKINLH